LSSLQPTEAQWFAKDALTTLADVTQVALLHSLAETGGERYAKLASLYATHFIAGEPYPAWALNDPEVWLPQR
jgi:hypothetical protein